MAAALSQHQCLNCCKGSPHTVSLTSCCRFHRTKAAHRLTPLGRAHKSRNLTADNASTLNTLVQPVQATITQDASGPPPQARPRLHYPPHRSRSRQRKNDQTFQWNVHIRECVDNERFDEAVESYSRMRASGVQPDYFTFPFVIKACSCEALDSETSKVHGTLIKMGLDADIYVCNSLIAAYSKMGRIMDAVTLFDEMPARDVVSWNSLMSGYVMAGDPQKALECLRRMNEGFGFWIDKYSVIAGFMACSLGNKQKQGKEIHGQVLRCGIGQGDIMVETSILDMYCKCRDLVLAERHFEMMPTRNIVAWNALITGYVLGNKPQEAFRCVRRMQTEGTTPDTLTLVNLLPCCVEIRGINEGRAIHGFAVRNDLLSTVVLDTALLDMYSKCGELRYAQKLFDRMAGRSVVSWNAMITAYVHNGLSMGAVEIFLQMQEGPLQPDGFTMSAVISAFTNIQSLRQGRQIHGYSLKLGFLKDTLVCNSVVYMYARCGDLDSSRKIYDAILHKDVISWNTIIMACAIHGQGKLALQLFAEMQEADFQPNHSSFVSVLLACSLSGMVAEGLALFNSMEDYGIDPQIEHYGCMVDLFGRKGELEMAESFIKRMPTMPTARIWGSLLTASRNHNNIDFAEMAAQNIFKLERDNTGCFVILSNMYAEAERWDDVERLKCQMKEEGIQKVSVRSVVELNCRTCSFLNADKRHPMTNVIYNIADIFSRKIGEPVYDTGHRFLIHELRGKKEGSSTRHCVRLAVCFGLISSKIGEPILVRKNVRVCSSCHNYVKFVSKLSKRPIIVGDTRIYHHFEDGNCSCNDYW